MKKLLLIFIACFTVAQSAAQDPELFENTWYLTNLFIDGESNIPPSNDEVEIVTLIANDATNEFSTGVCDFSGGVVNYSSTASEFIFTEYTETLGECGYLENDTFQHLYFPFFSTNLSNYFTYEITLESDGIKVLTITNADGNRAIYSDQFLHRYLFKTWYLQYMIVDGENTFLPVNEESFLPTIVLEETIITSLGLFLGDSGCDTFNGAVSYDAANTDLTLFDISAITNDCDIIENTEYATLYSEFLLEGDPQTFTYTFNIIEDVEMLLLGNTGGSWAVYSENISIVPDPDLFQTWYLTDYTFDLSDNMLVTDIIPPIFPTLTISEDLSFSGEGACNSFMGKFLYDNSGDDLLNNLFTTTEIDCEHTEHIDFEFIYFLFFSELEGFNYSITTEASGIKHLEFEFNGIVYNYADFPLSTPEFSQNTITIYPNPVTNTLFINAENLEIESLTIYSVSGQEIITQKSPETLSIDVSGLSKGLYFIELTSNSRKSFKKFIKN